MWNGVTTFWGFFVSLAYVEKKAKLFGECQDK